MQNFALNVADSVRTHVYRELYHFDIARLRSLRTSSRTRHAVQSCQKSNVYTVTCSQCEEESVEPYAERCVVLCSVVPLLIPVA